MELNYKEIGFRCGIEIHQQISNQKLFCKCSTQFKERNLELEFLRKLRASAGELGYVDIAAEFEQSRDREFVYHGYENEYCLVDCDDQPPYEINKDALITALSVSKLFNFNIADEIIVMRKVIIDGSACSSFQRTALIGTGTKDSFIKTSFGNVRVTSLCLEEDACKIEKIEGNKVYYSLSRQGIPLLEIRTEPDIKTPEHARETAEKIGMILRSFPNILRGIGTIRQDVNLSIKNKARIEIKGFQELRVMPKIIENEIQRQLKLLKENKKINPEVRRANDDGTTTFLRPLPGSARMYPDTDIPGILITKDLIKNIKLPKLINEQIDEIKNKHNLSKELSSEIIKKKINLNAYVSKYKNIKVGLLSGMLLMYHEEPNLEKALDLLNSGKITKDVFEDVVKTGKAEISKVNLSEIENEVKKIIKEKPELSVNGIMGMLMANYRGKVEGKKLIEIINKYATK